MSESDRDESGQRWLATPQDVIAVIKGTATPEQRVLVAEALADPYSSVSEFVRDIEQWAKDRLPRGGANVPTDASPQRQSQAKARLDAVLEFVRQKCVEGVFTTDEAAGFVTPGTGAPYMEAPPLSPVECNSLTVRILRAIEKAHPELAPELAPFRSDRRR